MIHYTCDRCQKKIDDESLRFVVRMEVQMEVSEPDSEWLDEENELESMQEALTEITEEFGEELAEEVFRQERFDLCCECYQAFKNNPVGAAVTPQVRFSQN